MAEEKNGESLLEPEIQYLQPGQNLFDQPEFKAGLELLQAQEGDFVVGVLKQANTDSLAKASLLPNGQRPEASDYFRKLFAYLPMRMVVDLYKSLGVSLYDCCEYLQKLDLDTKASPEELLSRLIVKDYQNMQRALDISWKNRPMSFRNLVGGFFGQENAKRLYGFLLETMRPFPLWGLYVYHIRKGHDEYGVLGDVRLTSVAQGFGGAPTYRSWLRFQLGRFLEDESKFEGLWNLLPKLATPPPYAKPGTTGARRTWQERKAAETIRKD